MKQNNMFGWDEKKNKSEKGQTLTHTLTDFYTFLYILVLWIWSKQYEKKEKIIV